CGIGNSWDLGGTSGSRSIKKRGIVLASSAIMNHIKFSWWHGLMRALFVSVPHQQSTSFGNLS
ncbi:hypothetical protein KI387_030230, partial [Taxus chinensis]